MKLIIPAALIMLAACGSNQTETPSIAEERITSDSLVTEANNDRYQPSQYKSTNQRDGKCLRQGYWIIYGKDEPGRGYPAESKIEEGQYKEDQKDGEWYYYNKKGEIDSIVTYDHGKWVKTMI